MSIQRVPAVPFTQIANTALRDRRLSYKARGLLAMVLSNVGEWNASLSWLTNQSDEDGRASVQTALNELTEYGYRVVTKERSSDGAEIRTIVTWYHTPNDTISCPAENLTVRNPDRQKTGASIEHHSSEHHQEEHQDKQTPDLFDEFWAAYPRKIGKGQARKAWAKAVKGTDAGVIVHAAVEFYRWCLREQTETQFIPHPSTWLNGERWLDERTETKQRSNVQSHLALAHQMWENETHTTPPVEG